ncbi:hypothetical protein BC830DRAFT_1175211, partial [Chytriomyces sp. MP71]
MSDGRERRPSSDVVAAQRLARERERDRDVTGGAATPPQFGRSRFDRDAGSGLGGNGGGGFGGNANANNNGITSTRSVVDAPGAVVASRRPSTSSSQGAVSEMDHPGLHPGANGVERNANGTSSQVQNKHQSRIVLHMAPRRSDSNNVMQPAQFFNYTSFGGKNHFPLIREETSIGRNNNNHIVLNDPKISKYHAIVKRVVTEGEKTGYYIKDKNSSNGVRVNSNTIIPDILHRLQDGDKVSIGVIVLTFVDEHMLGDTTPASAGPTPATRQSWYDTMPSLNRASRHQSMYLTKEAEENVKLVTILPSESQYEESVSISAEIQDEDIDFRPLSEVTDPNALKEDYEKLRLAYELSKISLTNDITPLLAKSLDLMFDILPIDRGVVLLVDETTGNL